MKPDFLFKVCSILLFHFSQPLFLPSSALAGEVGPFRPIPKAGGLSMNPDFLFKVFRIEKALRLDAADLLEVTHERIDIFLNVTS